MPETETPPPLYTHLNRQGDVLAITDLPETAEFLASIATTNTNAMRATPDMEQYFYWHHRQAYFSVPEGIWKQRHIEGVETADHYEVGLDILPGFVRSMFALATFYTRSQSSEYRALKAVVESQNYDEFLLAQAAARYAYDNRVNWERHIKELIGSRPGWSPRDVRAESLVGRTFILFGAELGDIDQYQRPALTTHNFKRSL